jgi:TonB family protein
MENLKLKKSIAISAFALLMAFSAPFSMASSDDDSPKKSTSSVKKRAMFHQNDQALYQYLNDHLAYPEALKNSGVEAKIVVEFVIDRKGNVTGIQVVDQSFTGKGAGNLSAYDQQQFSLAALDVFEAMSSWEPATINGTAIPQLFRIPISFKAE